MKNNWRFVAIAALTALAAVMGTVVLIHKDVATHMPQGVQDVDGAIDMARINKLKELCGGKNAVVEPAYQCFTKRGGKTRVILERDLK